jgi:quinoprotein glucose dehydrogenase
MERFPIRRVSGWISYVIIAEGRVARFSAVVVALLGLVLLCGGIWLIALGGSWYYAVAGIGFLVTAVLLWRRSPTALWLYALVTLGSLLWAVYEAGFDWWRLAPRGDIIILIGIWLLMPWVTRELRNPERPHHASAFSWNGLPLTAAVIAGIVVAVYAMETPTNDLSGSLPTASADEAKPNSAIPDGDWPVYGRTSAGLRYSPLTEITPANVAGLKVAWTYHTGDVRGEGDPVETTYEVTPLKIGKTLYLCTPHDIAIALDADTGKERWRYDAKVGKNMSRQHQTCRGVTYDEPASAAGDQTCKTRILLPTSDARLIALDAETGKVCENFADKGVIDLRANMPNLKPGFYYSTSPVVVARGLIIVGGAVNDNVSTKEPSGVIRAYDESTGRLVWNWDSGNPDETQPIAPGKTYTENSPNSWSILSVDPDLGLVYVPMGNAPPDQFGGNRSANVEKYSSSVVALDILTGQVRWVFQAVHHDLWDMDMPAQPELIDWHGPDGVVPALLQPTKQGDIYLLDRRTGKPLLPVTEKPAPKGVAKGDKAAPTQPISTITFNPARLTESDMWGATMFDQMACRILFRSLNYDGRYTPPSVKGSIIYPGNFGTFNWGGVAVDPVRQVIFATPVYLAFTSTLIPRENDTKNYVSEGKPGLNENYGAPYAAKMQPFLSPIGLPCQAPPWGYVAGVDLRSGQTVYQHKNGTVRDLSPLPLPFKMGVPGIGGPMMTAGGVAFYSGSLDYYVRAYDVTTGRKLWQARLPAGGQATPMSYQGSDGRQYVLVVAGGHGSTGTKAGDAVIAYALPKK